MNTLGKKAEKLHLYLRNSIIGLALITLGGIVGSWAMAAGHAGFNAVLVLMLIALTFLAVGFYMLYHFGKLVIVLIIEADAEGDNLILRSVRKLDKEVEEIAEDEKASEVIKHKQNSPSGLFCLCYPPLMS